MARVDDIFASNFKVEPYWWMVAPRPSEEPRVLPRRADAVIVGSDYTGLSAAMVRYDWLDARGR